MTDAPSGILACIGNTRMVPLRRLAPSGGARILLKLESENPTGSRIADRIGRVSTEEATAMALRLTRAAPM